MSTKPLLKVEALTKHFVSPGNRFTRKRQEVVKAVDNVSFEVLPGETVGLVGESGSGKSTTGYCILRLMDVSHGTITFDGRDVTRLRGKPLRSLRRDLQVIFQDPVASHNLRMTVGEIIIEPLDVHKIGDGTSRQAEMYRLLNLVGLDRGAARRRAHEFSGGQSQRIGIARALALKPKLIICDEPVSALDVSIQAQVLNLLKDIQQETRIAYLFIAHDLAVVRAISDRIEVMQSGRIVESGAAADVYEHPTHPYTKALLASAPIPNPGAMRTRRAERARLLAATSLEPG